MSTRCSYQLHGAALGQSGQSSWGSSIPSFCALLWLETQNFQGKEGWSTPFWIGTLHKNRYINWINVHKFRNRRTDVLHSSDEDPPPNCFHLWGFGAIQDMLCSHSCSFFLAVYQMDKERFFILSEPLIFLPREGLIQLPASRPLRCLAVSQVSTEAGTRAWAVEERLQAKQDTHQIALTERINQLDRACNIYPAVQKRNLFLSWVWLCFKHRSLVTSATWCLWGRGCFCHILCKHSSLQRDIWVLRGQGTSSWQLSSAGRALATNTSPCQLSALPKIMSNRDPS